MTTGHEYRVEMDLTEHNGEDSKGRVYISLVGAEGTSSETEFSRYVGGLFKGLFHSIAVVQLS